MKCRNDLSSRWWLLALLGLVLLFSARIVSAQEQPASQPPSSATSELSSLDTSELWGLYYSTLTRLEEQSREDRLALTSYVESATLREQSLTLTIEALRSDLTTVTQALTSSEASATKSRAEADSAIKTAILWRTVAIVSTSIAVALAAGVTIAIVL